MKASPARTAARAVLTRVRERTAYAHETLDAVLRERNLSARDAALATRLAYGAIATRGTLDEAVARFLAPAVKLEGEVSDALALGAYEVLFAGTPRHAAVSETVESVRAVRKPAAGLANAVMRRLADAAQDFPWGDPTSDIAALARLYGHPEWLAQLWVDELGHERAAGVMEANNGPAPLYLAHLPHLGDFDHIMASLVRDGAAPRSCELAGCILSSEPAAARRARVLAEHQVLVMDAAAQLAVDASRVEQASSLVEIGAGRGSKTVLIASHAPGAAITAVDLHAFKLEALRKAFENSHLAAPSTVCADAADEGSDLGIAEGSVDVVLVDAPCSGLGTLRRHPDRRWRARPQEIEALADLGARLLRRAARLVKPGGFVVYSTCTIARRENDEVVGGFLASDAGAEFETDSLLADVPDSWSSFVTKEGWFQSLPAPGGPDGHFIARLARARTGSTGPRHD